VKDAFHTTAVVIGADRRQKETLHEQYFFIFFMKPLFNQVNPTEIKKFYFKGDLDKTGSNKRNTQLHTKNTEQVKS